MENLHKFIQISLERYRELALYTNKTTNTYYMIYTHNRDIFSERVLSRLSHISGSLSGGTMALGEYKITFNGSLIMLVSVESASNIRYYGDVNMLIIGESMNHVEEFNKHLGIVSEEIEKEIAKTGIVDFWSSNDVTPKDGSKFSDLILAPGMISTIRANLDTFLKNRDGFAKFGLPYKRGILLAGAPGNGKTGIIRAIANEYPDFSTYLCMSFGEGYEDMKSQFDRRIKCAPTLIVFEDIDKSCPNQQKLAEFLNIIDGVSRKSGVFIIATSNEPEKLDRALLERPSRFDIVIRVDNPDDNQRESFIRKKFELELSEEQVNAIVKSTSGFSFAMLQEVWAGTVIHCLDRGSQTPDFSDIQHGLNVMQMSKKTVKYIKTSQSEDVGFKQSNES